MLDFGSSNVAYAFFSGRKIQFFIGTGVFFKIVPKKCIFNTEIQKLTVPPLFLVSHNVICFRTE
jgi:hypothetical protein